MLEMPFVFNFKVLNYVYTRFLHLENLLVNLFLRSDSQENIIFRCLSGRLRKYFKKSKSGREKEYIIMNWCVTRKFHPQTRKMSSETPHFLKNYSGPLVEFPCPTPIHMKDMNPLGYSDERLSYLSHVMRKPVFAICEQQRCRSACTSPYSCKMHC